MSYRPKYGNNLDLPIDAETIQGKSINTTELDSSTDIPTSSVVKTYVDDVKAYLTNTDNLLNTTGRFVEDVEEDGGLTKTGNALKHTNEIEPGTVGITEDTSGTTVIVPYFSYDENGHVVSKGTRSHTVTQGSVQTVTIDLSDTSDSTLNTLINNGHSFTYYDSVTTTQYNAIAESQYEDDGAYEYYYNRVYIIKNGNIVQLSGIIILTYRN